MNIDELNKKYASRFLEEAMKLVEEKQHLTLGMLEKHFDLRPQIANLLYEMIDAELQKPNFTD